MPRLACTERPQRLGLARRCDLLHALGSPRIFPSRPRVSTPVRETSGASKGLLSQTPRPRRHRRPRKNLAGDIEVLGSPRSRLIQRPSVRVRSCVPLKKKIDGRLLSGSLVVSLSPSLRREPSLRQDTSPLRIQVPTASAGGGGSVFLWENTNVHFRLPSQPLPTLATQQRPLMTACLPYKKVPSRKLTRVLCQRRLLPHLGCRSHHFST